MFTCLDEFGFIRTSMPDSDDGNSSDDSFENEEIKNKVLDVLKTFDDDCDGLLDHAEVASCLRVLGFSPTETELDVLFHQMPQTQDLYSFEVLLNAVLTATANGEWPRDMEPTIDKAFEVMEGGETLTRDSLISQLTTMGEPLTNSEVKQLVSHLPVGKNGQVDWKTYIKDTLKFIQS